MMTLAENGVNPSEFLEKAKNLQNTAIIICLPAAVVGIAVSFRCSCRIFERREKA
jgi:hypothetical protein